MRFVVTKLLVPIISVAALLLVLYVWNLNYQTKLRIDQVVKLSTEINNAQRDTTSNVDSLRNEIIQLQFERQSYTAHLEIMSNWFILFETILFGIFFLVGYGIFDNKIADSYEKSQAAYEKIHERNAHFENEFKSLKSDVYESMADINLLASMQSMLLYTDGNTQFTPYVVSNSLKALECTQNAFFIRPEHTKHISNIKMGLNTVISFMKEVMPNHKGEFIEHFKEGKKEEMTDVLRSMDIVSSNDNQDIKNLCAEFRYLFNEALKEPNP